MREKFGYFFLLAAGIFFLYAFFFLSGSRPNNDIPDNCLTCHSDSNDPSPSHPVSVLGCAVCHLGNPYAEDKDDAHLGMVLNPSDLRWAKKTCGQSACHAELAGDVRHSIMRSNSGLISATMYQWGELSDNSSELMSMEKLPPDTSAATSHLRKMCAGCHINKPRNDFRGEIGSRGGGCDDCHLAENDKGKDDHAGFQVTMSVETCGKCHNRSNRTALNYTGRFESEGYGTPYEKGGLSKNRLSGKRFYNHLPSDIHFQAGMTCIDCHNSHDVMGSGGNPAHLEEAVALTCESCHDPVFAKPGKNDITYRLLSVNANLLLPEDSLFALVSPGNFLSNVIREGEKAVLILKANGKKLVIPPEKDGVCKGFSSHDRLSCQACHSAYTPQCYGCHDIYDPSEEQMDVAAGEKTPGRWREGRSYLRFEKPTLALANAHTIMPVAPGCQVYLTELNSDSGISRRKTMLTMAAFDPHTTSVNVPGCGDCHLSPKRVGLGEGTVSTGKDGRNFIPIYNAAESNLDGPPLESVVDLKGVPLQKTSRSAERFFNAEEQKNIFHAGYCAICHDSYNDPVYRNFTLSDSLWRNGRADNCSGRKEK